MENEKPKIIQFQEDERGHVLILLDNGKVYRKTENGGPHYWVEEKWLDELIEYEGNKEIS